MANVDRYLLNLGGDENRIIPHSQLVAICENEAFVKPTAARVEEARTLLEMKGKGYSNKGRVSFLIDYDKQIKESFPKTSIRSYQFLPGDK